MHGFLVPAPGGGRFLIVSNANRNLVLDVFEASTASGAHVQVFPRNGGTNQLWQFGGNGAIVSVGSGLVLNVAGSLSSGNRITQTRYNRRANERFFPRPRGGALLFRIGGFNNNLCLDVRGGNVRPQTPVQAFNCHGGPNQLWRIEWQ